MQRAGARGGSVFPQVVIVCAIRAIVCGRATKLHGPACVPGLRALDMVAVL